MQRVYTPSEENQTNLTSGVPDGFQQVCESVTPGEYKDTFGDAPVVIRVGGEMFITCKAQGRLALDIQHKAHQLKTQKFFVALRGISVLRPGSLPPDGNSTTKVVVYFYQDLSEINLLVFFSCFFSAFFLLLGAGICAWKVRETYRLRRLRAQAAQRREVMSRRPFLNVSVLWSKRSDPANLGALQQTPLSIFSRRKPPSKLRPPTALHSMLAAQPTVDERAAVVTGFIRLPGPAKGGGLMFASTLAGAQKSDPLAAGLKFRGGHMSSMAAQLSKPWHSRHASRVHEVNPEQMDEAQQI